MDAIGYVRVSTAEQADSGLGVAAQEERIRAYCQMKGLALQRMFADLGVSGGKRLRSRPNGAAMLAALKAGRTLAVVVLKLDRAFRNAVDCLATIEKWDCDGIALHIVDLGGNSIDSTTAAGKFMLTVLAGAAEMERNLIRERTKAALAIKRTRGERLSRYLPYGYDLAPDGIALAENQAGQAIAGQIASMRASGRSLSRIARELNQSGVQAKHGGAWSHKVVGSVIKRHDDNGDGQ
ncbi:MAG: recombinase family protein [Planctomycetota bacterium]|jgi:DNA invertase Pin-like site-specific DNA recombinase